MCKFYGNFLHIKQKEEYLIVFVEYFLKLVFVFPGPGSRPQFVFDDPGPNWYLTISALNLYLLAWPPIWLADKTDYYNSSQTKEKTKSTESN